MSGGKSGSHYKDPLLPISRSSALDNSALTIRHKYINFIENLDFIQQYSDHLCHFHFSNIHLSLNTRFIIWYTYIYNCIGLHVYIRLIDQFGTKLFELG